MTDSQRAGFIAAAIALMVAITGFVQAKTATEKAHEAVSSERSLGDNYQSYVEDRLRYETALEDAFKDLQRRCKKPCPRGITIEDCLDMTKNMQAQDIALSVEAAASPAPPEPDPVQSVDLNALATRYGYAYIK